MKRRRIDVGGLSLSVVERDPRNDQNNGIPIVLLHGFTGCAASMDGAAQALASKFRTLGVDAIGHGESDAPTELDPYAMSAFVEQLKLLLDALEIERAHWLGYSMGGRTALHFAAAHPDRVARMLLVGASAGLADANERAARTASDEALADRIEREGLEAFVDSWMALPLFASQKRLGVEALRAARDQRLTNRPYALANSLRGMGSGAQEPLAGLLPNLSVPTCFVVGDEDAKFQAIAGDLASRLPDALVAIVPESGHAAHLENPAAFARIAEDFFASETRA